jgi:midasin
MMCQFIGFLRQLSTTHRFLITVRDLLSWISFINLNPLNWRYAYEHGAHLVFIDAIDDSCTVKQPIVDFLAQQHNETVVEHRKIERDGDRLTLGTYSIGCGPSTTTDGSAYCFDAPTTIGNVERLLRAMQLSNKPILIEGNPGVGKTSLVMALARLAGHSFIRINLSEQTDISDLFGSDLPDVDSGQAGRFQWQDGPLLTAIKTNQWIVLDEVR